MYQKFLKFLKENSKKKIILKYDGLGDAKRYTIIFMDLENGDDFYTSEINMPMEVFCDFFNKYITNPIENSDVEFYISDVWKRFYDKTIQLFGEDLLIVLSINDSADGEWFFVVLEIGEETYCKNGLSLDEMNSFPDDLSLDYLIKRGWLLEC